MNHATPPSSRAFSRRSFLATTALSTTALAFEGAGSLTAAEGSATSPIAVFSKVYQELNLDFAAAAEATADAGLNGVDCPVRAGGEIEPEKAADQLPHYAQALSRFNLRVWLLTTGILSPATPFTETVLRTAKKLGISYYRLGFIKREPGNSQMREVRAHLKDLAAMNRELGLCALLQNHSPAGQSTYFGGDLGEMEAAVDSFAPAEIGVAFDIGHALVVHGSDWRKHFEILRPHFKIAYIKDVKRGTGWVPFGEGEIAGTGYFQVLRNLDYRAPISMHVEFDWTNHGARKSRADLVQALKDNLKVLQGWLSRGR